MTNVRAPARFGGAVADVADLPEPHPWERRMVDLTSEQRRQLDELAGEIAHDNPRLARALAGHWYAVRVRRDTRKGCGVRRSPVLGWWALLLMLAAVPLLITGAVLAQPELILAGAIAIVNGPALLTAVRSRRPPAP
jgi:hypothetical protein